MMNWFLPLSAACIALLIFLLLRRLITTIGTSRTNVSSKSPPEKTPLHDDPYAAIEALPDFDWRTEAPIKLRPFKPKYHLSMSLENLPLSDLIAIDDTYLTRMRIRQSTMAANPPDATTHCNPVAAAAVLEFHAWLLTTYLPRRFPTLYTLGATALHNAASGADLPLAPASPLAALHTLGANIDTDFIWLLPRAGTDGAAGPVYHMEAYATCFPSGVRTRELSGQPVAAIHGPVPGYAAKLGRSMDRFFARLEPGRAVRRDNWTVTTDDQLYKEAGNHMHVAEGSGGEETAAAAAGPRDDDASGGADEAEVERQKAEVVVEECRLRCERQTLHRLPRTGAVVFAFKTYQYPLAEVKAEGLGPALAEAIDGLKLGNVPGMAVYKRGVVWGEKVKEYLLS